jgi:hypothetical protein
MDEVDSQIMMELKDSGLFDMGECVLEMSCDEIIDDEGEETSSNDMTV